MTDLRFEFASGPVLPSRYAYDEETGILAVRIGDEDSGECGAVELADEGGGILLIHTRSGIVDGVEIVVWPEVESGNGLTPPEPTEQGMVVPPLEVDEIECDVVAIVNDAGNTLRLAVNDGHAAHTIQVADKLMLDLDEDNELTGIWLMEIPQGVSVTV